MDIEIYEETLRGTETDPLFENNNEYEFYYNCKDIMKIIGFMILITVFVYLCFLMTSIQR